MTELLATKLAVLLTTTAPNRANAIIIDKAMQARGKRCNAVIWLREPTDQERSIILPCIIFNSIIEEYSATREEP